MWCQLCPFLTCFPTWPGVAQRLLSLLRGSKPRLVALGQVRLAHRVAELENLPYGLSAKAPVLKVSAASPASIGLSPL